MPPPCPVPTTSTSSPGCNRRPPEMQQLVGAPRGNQARTDRFFGTIAGTVAIPAFYSPENLAQFVAAAARQAA